MRTGSKIRGVGTCQMFLMNDPRPLTPRRFRIGFEPLAFGPNAEKFQWEEGGCTFKKCAPTLPTLAISGKCPQPPPLSAHE